MNRILRAAEGKKRRKGGLNVVDIKKFLKQFSSFDTKIINTSRREQLENLLGRFINEDDIKKRPILLPEQYERYFDNPGEILLLLGNEPDLHPFAEEILDGIFIPDDFFHMFVIEEKIKIDDGMIIKENFDYNSEEEKLFIEGLCYLYGFGIKVRNYKKAYQSFLESSNSGFQLAIIYKALCLECGIGIDKNEELAFEITQDFDVDDIIDIKSDYSWLCAALMLDQGFGGHSNRNRAVQMYELDRGITFAISRFYLFVIYQEEDQHYQHDHYSRKAIRCLEYAEWCNNLEASCMLCKNLRRQGKYIESLKIIVKGVKLNDPESIIKYGDYHYRGIVVKKDIEKAKKYYKQAISLGCGKGKLKIKMCKVYEKSWDAEVIEKDEYNKMKREQLSYNLLKLSNFSMDMCELISKYMY